MDMKSPTPLLERSTLNRSAWLLAAHHAGITSSGEPSVNSRWARSTMLSSLSVPGVDDCGYTRYALVKTLPPDACHSLNAARVASSVRTVGYWPMDRTSHSQLSTRPVWR